MYLIFTTTVQSGPLQYNKVEGTRIHHMFSTPHHCGVLCSTASPGVFAVAETQITHAPCLRKLPLAWRWIDEILHRFRSVVWCRCLCGCPVVAAVQRFSCCLAWCCWRRRPRDNRIQQPVPYRRIAPDTSRRRIPGAVWGSHSRPVCVLACLLPTELPRPCRS